MKIEKDPSGQRPFRYDTPYWSHFGTGKGWAYGRCNRCLEHVYSTRTPNEDTVNCWKVLVFGDAVSDFGKVREYLVERAREDPLFLGKWNKKDSLAVVYATSEERREELKASILRDLRNRRLLKKDHLPYRRGCKAFERVLGDWHSWEAGKNHFEGSGQVNLDQLKED